MASKTITMLTDDIDGSEATETVRFGLDGKSFEIDLSKSHAKKLRSDIERYIKSGRKTGGRRTSRTASPSDRNKLRDMRTWAKAQGMQVSERGRVSATVQEAYRKTHA